MEKPYLVTAFYVGEDLVAPCDARESGVDSNKSLDEGTSGLRSVKLCAVAAPDHELERVIEYIVMLI